MAILSQPSSQASLGHVRETEAAAAALRISLDRLEVEDIPSVEPALRLAQGRGAQALIVPPVGMLSQHAQQIVDIANEAGLPLVSDTRFVAAGALAGYSDDRVDRYRHVADYVNRILNGANPASLPVMQPTTFQLAVNLKTAQALGIDMPQTLLARADEVIE